ncbi:MAG TPA: mannose-1-phosphate guanylyltransferase, partial [Candidatus Solibacter sp.]
MSNSIDFRPVILAGGSGTRFWPRSRRARAKQVLALDGERSMIQQTVERLKPLSGPTSIWVVTNEFLAQEIADQLKGVPASQIVQEPVARNTAPACGLAALLVERDNPDAVLGVFPSDHVIGDEPRFLKALQKGIQMAAAGENMIVLGIEPTRPETGYGYIETGDLAENDSALHVRRFTEKPNLNRAQDFVAAGNYYWNSGIFIWSARTLANAVREHLPEMAPLLEKIAAAYGTPQFEQVFRELYPKCENISVDYAVLEPRSAKGEHLSNLYCLPAEFSWNDLGSWGSLYEYQIETRLRGDGDGNVA